MSLGRRARLLMALTALLLLLAGCSREETVATLTGFTGTVQRDHLAAVGRWQAGNVGEKFVIGEAIRTSASSTAMLKLFEKDQLSLEPKTVLRFLAQPSNRKRARVSLELGQATLQAAGDVLEVETELGTARIAPHGQVRLTREGDASRFEVTIGSAEVLRNGQKWELEVGDAVDVRFEQPLRHGSPTPSASAALAAAAAPAPDASADPASSANAPAGDVPESSAEAAIAGAAAALPRGPSRVDLVVRAGDSVVIHDPKPPTAVGVLAGGSCAQGTVLTLDPGRAKPRETLGDGQVTGELGPGSHRYLVRCLEVGGKRGPKLGEGTISVLADAGSRQLAKTAPATDVETDGRRYTVLYQSLLPRISVRWPGAPAASSYTLRVTSPNGSRSFSAATASYAFAPGALIEGEHTLTFEGGGARSRSTGVAIRFDNAAPTASIASPADGSFSAGQQVLVAGTALPGWTVSVGGENLPQDAQNRFSATVASTPGLGALAIRFAQPQRGVHYYLRRSAH